MSKNDKMLAVIIFIMIAVTCALVQGKKARASVTLCLSCPQRPGTVAAWDVQTRAATGHPGVHLGTWREGQAPEAGHWVSITVQ